MTDPRRRDVVLPLAAAALAALAAWWSIVPATRTGAPATDVTIQRSVMPTEAQPPRVAVAELPESVAEVIAERGYASYLSRAELEAALPRSVVDVLIARRAALAVADAGAEVGP